MSQFAPAERKQYMPTIDILKPQGDSRFIARVHPNEEYKTASGLVISNTEQQQDIPTTGDVLSCSPMFDKEKFPDIRAGMCVKVARNGWATFVLDGELFAVGTAAQVLAVYDPKDLG